MQETEPDAIAKEGRTCFAVETKRQLAAGISLDLAMPKEVNFALVADYVERQREGVATIIKPNITDFGSYRSPCAVSHWRIYSSPNFVFSGPYVSKERVLWREYHGKRPSTQLDRFCSIRGNGHGSGRNYRMEAHSTLRADRYGGDYCPEVGKRFLA
jgi:hypothetical protein